MLENRLYCKMECVLAGLSSCHSLAIEKQIPAYRKLASNTQWQTPVQQKGISPVCKYSEVPLIRPQCRLAISGLNAE